MKQLILFILLVPVLLNAELYEGSDSLKPKKEYTYKAKGGLDIDPNLLEDLIPDDPRIKFATYFCGSGGDAVMDLQIDSEGNILAIGNTMSDDLPMVGNSFATDKGIWIDAFIVKFDTLGFPIWSTYFGGKGEDRGIRLEVDSKDNIIIAGATNSANFPLKGEFDQDSIKGEADIYIAKFDKDGNLLWSRLFGGSGLDQSFGLAIDADDNIYVAGNTMSTDIVRSDWTYQPEYAYYYKNFATYSDGVFAKFSPSGKHIWSSYLGAGETEHLEDIDVYNDEITVVGRVSANFAHPKINPRYIRGTEDAIQQVPCDTFYYENYTPYDPFIAKFSTDSCKLKYFTYYCTEAKRFNPSDNYYYFSDYDARGNYILVINADNFMQVKGSPFKTYNEKEIGGVMMLSLSQENIANWDWDICAGRGFTDVAFHIDNNIFWGDVTAYKDLFPEDDRHINNRESAIQRSPLFMRFDLKNYTQWYSYHPHFNADSKLISKDNIVYLMARSHDYHILKNAYSEQYYPYSLYFMNFDMREDFGYSSIETGTNYSSNIYVYPTIAMESITISSEDSINQIQIYDLLGKQLYSQDLKLPLNELEINVENYADGMYFILLNNKYFFKFIKE